MAQIGEAILQARKSNLTDIDAIAKIDKQLLAKEVEAKDFAIDKEVKDKHITEAQGEQLKFANAILATAKAITVDNQAAEQHAQANLEMQIAANDNQKELLGIQDQLAVTQKEHRDIQLRILEIDKQEERARLEAVGASKTTSDAEKQIAAAKLKQLDAVYTGKAEVVKNQTAGPGEAYLKSIIDDAKSVNEALQNIEVSGLKSLNDGLVEAIMGAKSLGEVFTNVANQIIADLLRIAIQKMIIGPIAHAIFGGSGGGSAASSAITVDTTGNIFNHFAAGTNNAPSGMALVGENGPELVRFRGGEQVVPNHMLNGGAGNIQVEIVDTTGLFVTRVNDQIISAAPAIAEAGSTVAQSRLAYRQSRSLAA